MPKTPFLIAQNYQISTEIWTLKPNNLEPRGIRDGKRSDALPIPACESQKRDSMSKAEK